MAATNKIDDEELKELMRACKAARLGRSLALVKPGIVERLYRQRAQALDVANLAEIFLEERRRQGRPVSLKEKTLAYAIGRLLGKKPAL